MERPFSKLKENMWTGGDQLATPETRNGLAHAAWRGDAWDSGGEGSWPDNDNILIRACFPHLQLGAIRPCGVLQAGVTVQNGADKVHQPLTMVIEQQDSFGLAWFRAGFSQAISDNADFFPGFGAQDPC